MFKKLVILTLCLLLCATTVLAEVGQLSLPSATVEVQEEAFAGLEDIESVILPEGLQTIGDRAFADMPKLKRITIPSSVTTFGNDIVSGSMDAVLVNCEPGSKAMNYARYHNLDYNADTCYRVLAIGETYPDAKDPLNGPDFDLDGMEKALNHLSGIDFEITTALNPKMAEFDTLIASAFPKDKVKEQDVSIFYYSGHGNEYGYLIGSDWKYYTPSKLKQTLNALPGRKLVIIDACYSGKILDTLKSKSVVSNGVSDAEEIEPLDDVAVEEAFNDAFLEAFRPTMYARSANAQQQPVEFFVITACARDQESYSTHALVDGVKHYFGLFTMSLCEAIGWSEVYERAYATMKGDVDGDDAVSIGEAYIYSKERVANILSARPENQDVQAYPEDCRWFAPFRN